MRKLTLTLSLLLLVIACALLLGAILYFGNPVLAPARLATSSPTRAIISQAAPTLVAPTIGATSTPEPGSPTLNDLLKIDVPRDDPLQIVPRLRKTSGVFATPAAAVLHKVGDQANFWVSRDITGTYELITATLRYVTPHSYMWLGQGENVGDAALKSAGDTFENKIYPTDRQNFGSEWTPGIDNDPHIYILNTHFNGAIGYFSSADEYPTFVNRFSNQHEMFYMNLRGVRPGTDGYAAVLAHEFTHMIHWHENGREGSWITEGFGDLGMKLNGFPQDVSGFVRSPDLQLDAWAQNGDAIPHYEAAYLFLSYLLNRFGDKFTHDLIDSGTHDLYTVQKALDENGTGLKFDDVFSDWTVANLIDDESLGPRYFYTDRPLGISPQKLYSTYPVNSNGIAHQYATEYVQLLPGGKDVTFTFDGAKTVPVIPTQPHNSKMMWWGNRVDMSDTTLTHEFDLSLNFAP